MSNEEEDRELTAVKASKRKAMDDMLKTGRILVKEHIYYLRYPRPFSLCLPVCLSCRHLFRRPFRIIGCDLRTTGIIEIHIHTSGIKIIPPVKYISLPADITEQRRGEDTEGPQDDPNIPPQNVDQQHGQGDANHKVMLLMVLLRNYSINNHILAMCIGRLYNLTFNFLSRLM